MHNVADELAPMWFFAGSCGQTGNTDPGVAPAKFGSARKNRSLVGHACILT